MQRRDDTGKPGDPKRFIAVNILPPRDDKDPGTVVAELGKQIDAAIAAGFNYAWINPISAVSANTPCTRLCFDTGVNTTLYQSLYAQDDPLAARKVFDQNRTAIRDLNLKCKTQKNFYVMVDFVWKHVSKNSKLVSDHPGWFGAELKDIIEYNFASTEAPLIIARLKQVIDLYLDPVNGYGFAGLRIDAASQLSPHVRSELYTYIQAKYKDAIIFEEVLFDRAQQTEIKELTEAAMKQRLFSQFVTSNIYYQRPDAYGALPLPEAMGDGDKLKLANNNAIGFTGNHDHFSAGWGIILMMAAERACANQGFMAAISRLRLAPASNDKLKPEDLTDTIARLANKSKTIEGLTVHEQPCLRYLLPFANQIARELLDFKNNKKTLHQFRKQLFEKIVNTTLTSPSGYFMLISELQTAFENQRIFSNMHGGSLQTVLLTGEELLRQKQLTDTVITKMQEEVEPVFSAPAAEDAESQKDPKKSKSRNGNNETPKNIEKQQRIHSKQLKAAARHKNNGPHKYDNLANFEKNVQFRFMKANADQLINAQIWHPYIIEFLRHHPELLSQYEYYARPESVSKAGKDLAEALGIREFISQINNIYANLATIGCLNYHTFTSLDQFKIILRCTEDATDIILINIDPDKTYTLFDEDIKKIAAWYQARIFPPDRYVSQEIAASERGVLQNPFDHKAPTYFHGSYSANARQASGDKFDDAYKCVTGMKPNHQTNLHLGYGFELNLQECATIKVVTHLRTQREVENDIFERRGSIYAAPVVMFPRPVSPAPAQAQIVDPSTPDNGLKVSAAAQPSASYRSSRGDT